MYYKETVDKVLEELDTGREGLAGKEPELRLKEYGSNELAEKEKISPIKIFIEQFHSFIVYILLAAIIISVAMGEYVDSGVILAILIINSIIGFIQEYKSEKAIDALKKLSGHKATVIRQGKEQEIDAINIVPGDIIKIETGDRVPADARILDLMNLQTDESSLTGESVPVKKNSDVIEKDIGVADRTNMVYSSTVVTKGRAMCVVTDTGMKTEVGKIAKLIGEVKKESTPLQHKLDRLGKWIGNITIGICFIVFIAGVLTGKDTLNMFLAAVALAVAAVPEGLPAVVTISLALGVRRMVKKNALIRTLPSVETLGSTNVICTDKTGTLTKNEMTVEHLYVDSKIVDVSGFGYEAEGDFSVDGGKISAKELDSLKMFLRIGLLNNDSRIDKGKVKGDPTEAALLVSAEKAGLIKDEENTKNPRVDEIGFDSERKLMTTVHQQGNKKMVYVKGAPDILINHCTHIQERGTVRKLNKDDKGRILQQNEDFARKALRVLGFAYKEQKGKLTEDDLVFAGLQAMIDPAREEVEGSIKRCRDAGIRVIMITGDHEVTAKAIAQRIGIKGESITGEELSKIKNINGLIDKISIFARVNPEHKLRIVEALQKKGNIVAMTGDGVNDAPALKKADIGVSMGKSGTDVAKEASDMILLDDNFVSIVNAVEEGRGVYDNIRKFFALLISGNIGEVAIIFFALIMGLPIPLTAIMILLINLVTDGLPATALGVDPFEPNAMKRKPRPKDEPIQEGLNAFVYYYPVIMTVTVLGFFYYMLQRNELAYAQTAAFLCIVMFEMFQAFSARSTRYTSFRVGIFKNMWLILAVISSLVIMFLAIHLKSMNVLFGTTPLGIHETIVICLVSSIGFIFIETYKAVTSREGQIHE